MTATVSSMSRWMVNCCLGWVLAWVQYSTVQYSTVQYSTVQYSTVQYSTVQYSTVPDDGDGDGGGADVVGQAAVLPRSLPPHLQHDDTVQYSVTNIE